MNISIFLHLFILFVISTVTYVFWNSQLHNQSEIQSAVNVIVPKVMERVQFIESLPIKQSVSTNAVTPCSNLTAPQETSMKAFKGPFLKDFGQFAKNQYDDDDIVYPIPFNKLYQDISNRYVNYSKPNAFFPQYILTGDLPAYDNQSSDILVMTGASDNHAHGAFMMMYSVLLADPYVSLLFVDLGLSSTMMTHLKAHFDTMHQIQVKMRSRGFLAYRKYNWKAFPVWMDLKKSALKLGGYSWKAITICDAFFQWKGMFSWLDSGTIILDGFSREFTLARRYGFFAPPSPGTIRSWTHKETLRFMRQHKLAPNAKDSDPNCSSEILFADYSKPFVQELMIKSLECGYTQKCIAPKGSFRRNHRFDQAVLSMLISEYKIPKSANISYYFHPALRNEGGNIRQILANILIPLQQAYHISLTNSIYDTSKMKYVSTKIQRPSRKIDF